jgi:hypothetical protein
MDGHEPDVEDGHVPVAVGKFARFRVGGRDYTVRAVAPCRRCGARLARARVATPPCAFDSGTSRRRLTRREPAHE